METVVCESLSSPLGSLYCSSKCYCHSFGKDGMYLPSHTSKVNLEIPDLSRILGKKREEK